MAKSRTERLEAAVKLDRARRERQFLHYIELVGYRTRCLVKSDCLLVFSVPMPLQVRRRLDAKSRIIQFAFMADSYYLDLPDSTMTPEEFRRVVKERPDFEYALMRKEKRLGEREFDPLQRIYSYGSESVAASDVGYVMFDVYGVKPTAAIKVSSASFKTGDSWEDEWKI